MRLRPSDRCDVAVICARLIAHADSRCTAVHALAVRALAERPAVLCLQFALEGELRGLRIAAIGTPVRADELWRHTCFEAFVRRDGEPGYLEFNFSPSGAWQAYQFSDYRQGRLSAELPSPPQLTIGVRESAVRMDEALVLEALVTLPAPYADAPRGVHLAMSAVVEDEAGSLSYWALRHAAGRADFHHPDAFTLRLPWS